MHKIRYQIFKKQFPEHSALSGKLGVLLCILSVFYAVFVMCFVEFGNIFVFRRKIQFCDTNCTQFNFCNDYFTLFYLC